MPELSRFNVSPPKAEEDGRCCCGNRAVRVISARRKPAAAEAEDGGGEAERPLLVGGLCWGFGPGVGQRGRDGGKRWGSGYGWGQGEGRGRRRAGAGRAGEVRPGPPPSPLWGEGPARCHLPFPRGFPFLFRRERRPRLGWVRRRRLHPPGGGRGRVWRRGWWEQQAVSKYLCAPRACPDCFHTLQRLFSLQRKPLSGNHDGTQNIWILVSILALSKYLYLLCFKVESICLETYQQLGAARVVCY